jgi:F420-non-reducing hydrogenase large subunit
MQRISIDPITRLEGHGKIEIFLNEEGDVANTYFQIPELRGATCGGNAAAHQPDLRRLSRGAPHGSRQSCRRSI